MCAFLPSSLFTEKLRPSRRPPRKIDILKNALTSKKLPFYDFNMNESTPIYGYLPVSSTPTMPPSDEHDGLLKPADHREPTPTSGPAPAQSAAQTLPTTPAGPTSEPVAAERATLGLALGRGRRGQQGGKQPPITPESKGKKRAAEELPSQVPREKRAKGDGSLSPSKAFRGAGGVENNNTDNDQVQETLSWTTLSTKVHGMIDQGVKRQDVLSLLLATKWHHCAGLVRQVTRSWISM